MCAIHYAWKGSVKNRTWKRILRIHPWSVYRVDLPGSSIVAAASGSTLQAYYIYAYLVKVTDRPLWYWIIGTADEEHHAQVANEMRQIRDSFRIEKVSGK